jgi:hypothetical protein
MIIEKALLLLAGLFLITHSIFPTEWFFCQNYPIERIQASKFISFDF